MAKGMKTGGRTKGALNKRTIERKEQLAEVATIAAQTIGDAAFEGDAHAYLMLVYKDPECSRDDRLKAATAAIGYEKPKLASVESKSDTTVTMGSARSPAERRAIAEKEAAEMLERVRKNAARTVGVTLQ